jgi:hypothetical protein
MGVPGSNLLGTGVAVCCARTLVDTKIDPTSNKNNRESMFMLIT